MKSFIKYKPGLRTYLRNLKKSVYYNKNKYI